MHTNPVYTLRRDSWLTYQWQCETRHDRTSNWRLQVLLDCHMWGQGHSFDLFVFHPNLTNINSCFHTVLAFKRDFWSFVCKWEIFHVRSARNPPHSARLYPLGTLYCLLCNLKGIKSISVDGKIPFKMTVSSNMKPSTESRISECLCGVPNSSPPFHWQ